MSNTIKVLFRNRIVLIFILFVFMFSGTVFAYDYGKEYSENTEDYDVYSMVLDGQPRIIIIYTESMVVLDLINLKPLFDLSGEQQQLTTIFQQEYYNQKYSSLSRDHFKNLLANELSLDASFPCQAIDYDKIIIDKAIISSEEYAIKKFIPKKCIEAPLDCKEIVNNAKSAINQIAKIDNYASPQVILAVYCKGESAWVIPKIIAPARQIDAITTNIQERAYLTGQIESLYSSKTELQSQLSYGTRNLGDFGRDGYFAMKEAGDFLHKSAVQTGNVFLSFANKITNLFGVNISKAIMEEPEYWSQKLAKTRNLSSQQYTNDDLASSQLFSEQATTKSMNKLNRLKTRNMLIHNDVDINLGNYWTDWFTLYWKILFYDYNTTHIAVAKESHNLLSSGLKEHNQYLYNSAFTSFNASKSKLAVAIDAQKNAESSKVLNPLKIILWIIGIAFFVNWYKKRQSAHRTW